MMNQTIKNILENQGILVDDFIFIDKTCDNIRLQHKASGKEINVRW